MRKTQKISAKGQIRRQLCVSACECAFVCVFVSWRASLVAQIVKNLPANAEDAGEVDLIPGLGRSLGEGNGYPLQYFCLENSMDRGACRATVHGIAESDMTERLSHTHTHTHIRHLTGE